MTKINFQNVHTMVGADAVIDGPINLREGIIIYGTVKGPVNTNGPVRVAENGNVHGNILVLILELVALFPGIWLLQGRLF